MSRAFIAMVSVIGLLWVIGSLLKEPAPPKSQADIRKERIERSFDSWDGSHRGLTALIKKAMNDPDSYAHVETKYIDNGNHIIVTTTFRGKNAFGGVVKNAVTAQCDLDGNVIRVMEQGE